MVDNTRENNGFRLIIGELLDLGKHFPQKGRGLGHMTLKIMACLRTRTYLQNPLKLQISNLVKSFIWQIPQVGKIFFSEKGRGHMSRDAYNFGHTLEMSPKPLKLLTSNSVYSFN